MGKGESSTVGTLTWWAWLHAAALGLALGVACNPPGACASQSGPTPQLTIQVYNFRQIPSVQLANAEAEARRIFAQAGLQTVWLECPVDHKDRSTTESCSRLDRPDVLKLIIVSGPKQNIFLDSVSGQALPPSTAAVFFDYLPRLPSDRDTPSNTALVLGCVITHEIAHLLLGEAHSVAGILQSEWGPEQLRLVLMGNLIFLTEQSSRMQREVWARIEKSHQTPTAMLPNGTR